jgi:hypothetical protein
MSLFPFILSVATTSASNMNVSAAGQENCFMTSTRSGNLDVVSSPFREKIHTVPSSNLWIWARWPSYLYSQVKAFSWERLKKFLNPLSNFCKHGFYRYPWDH